MKTGRYCSHCPDCSCAALDAAELVTPARITEPMGMNPVALGRGRINARVSDTPNYIGGGVAQTQPVINQSRAWSRTEIVLALKAIEASRGGIAEAIAAFERME